MPFQSPPVSLRKRPSVPRLAALAQPRGAFFKLILTDMMEGWAAALWWTSSWIAWLATTAGVNSPNVFTPLRRELYCSYLCFDLIVLSDNQYDISRSQTCTVVDFQESYVVQMSDGRSEEWALLVMRLTLLSWLLILQLLWH